MKQFFLIAFAFLALHANSQQTDFVLVPGKSAGKVKLGMSEAQVHSVLKGKFTVKSYAQELKDFAGSSSNYHLDSIPQFVLGFDKSLTAENSALEYSPVFNMYFLHDKLVYIGITSYSLDSAMKASVVMKGNIRFDMLQEDCISALGEDYLPISYGSYTGDHVYYHEGFEMTYDEGILTFIGIFRADEKYPEQIALRSKKLRADQAKMEH